MLKKFESFIREKELPINSAPWLLAVSGGIDSMVLLHLCLQSGLIPGFAVAHCNFQLRGEDSDKDEKFVIDFCAKHQVAVFTKRFETESYAREQGISIQMAARDLRYQWFNELVESKGFGGVALAQHLDDQTETFFINLIRGTGIAGLHGISIQNGKLIRPLMFTGRKEIELYQKENKVPFREDQSNNSDKYLRNYIRHHISPQFEKLSPGFNQTLNQNVRHLREVEQFYKKMIHRERQDFLHQKNDGIHINIDALLQTDSVRLHLYELLSEYGFNIDSIQNVNKLIHNPVSGKIFRSATHELLINRTEIIIRKNSAANNKVYALNFNESIQKPVFINVEILHRIPENLKTPEHIAYFDLDKLQFPLKLRHWNKSDYFYPFGMKGKKKLSDYFIDQKISLFDKQNIWVLLSGNDIIWIIGHRTDNRFRVDGNTKNIYKMTLDYGNS
jgi:tRNA(Ile)-lysidine synthase